MNISDIPSIVRSATSAERYSQEYRDAWRSLFVLATSVAKTIPNRDIDPVTLVDDWVAEHEIPTNHCHPDDDATCGDVSCLQALAIQQREYLNDLKTHYYKALRQWSNPHLSDALRKKCRARVDRLRKLWEQENNTNIRQVSYDSHEALGSGAHFDTVEQPTETERAVRRREYATDFVQEPECDPDDAHTVRDTKRYNRGRPRGSVGVLAGLYENTDPEPTYRAPDRRRLILKTYLSSDNALDIELAYSMIPMRRKEHESDADWAVRLSKRRRNRDALISKLNCS